MMELNQNNISTISVLIYIIISPILVKFGIDIDQTTFVGIMIPAIGLILALWSARNPNEIEALGNKPPVTEQYDENLNHEYTISDGDEDDGGA